MTKRLILTEKPSVARDLVEALGGFTAKGGRSADYWESADWVCTYAVGHLVEFLEPDEINPLYKRWNMDDLPIIPEEFKWRIKSGMDRRMDVIQKLMKRNDVVGFVNGCDAAREGELIFREIVAYFGIEKKIQRLWLQSMTPESIRAAFSLLRAGSEFEGLAAAASCRAKSDWLIGMNATRAMSLRLNTRSDRGVWSAGRVQTPTLALLVSRELEILEHAPRSYWRVKAEFGVSAGSYEGYWFDPKFKKDELRPDSREDRFFDRSIAESVIALVTGKTGTATETRKQRVQKAPLLFDLTGLQRAMSQRFGWTAKRTLEAAQRCYETHKSITYPRTSSVALPNDYRGKIKSLLEKLSDHDRYAVYARALLGDGLQNERRNFDDSKVTDHFAIIPTGYRLSGLSGDDGVLLDAVVRRSMASFFPDAIYDKVERITVVETHSFRTGPIETLVTSGWLAVYDRSAKTNDKTDSDHEAAALKNTVKKLADLGPKTPATVLTKNAQAEADVTKPPPRIGEAALLGLMENAGRQVEDAELAAALMKAEGLGTAATRAEIIENLKIKAYIDANLRPTPKGIQLIDSLQRIGAQRLTSADLTAKMELDLNHVEQGKKPAASFMQSVEEYIGDIVEASRKADFNVLFSKEPALGKCPVCRNLDVFERHRFYLCESFGQAGKSCGFYLPKDLGGRYMNRSECTKLLRDGKTGEIDGFVDEEGRGFKAVVAMAGEKPVILPIDKDSSKTKPGRAPVSKANQRAGAKKQSAADEEMSSGATVAQCPIHKSDGIGKNIGARCLVTVTKSGYSCSTRLEEQKTNHPNPSGFWMPRKLCQREMTISEIKKLIEQSTTPELSGFISKAGKPFKAKLKLDETGSWSFDFDRPATGKYSYVRTVQT